MPKYDYQCRECQHRFELRQGFDADTVTDCPECGAIAERQISLVPVIFKGSGWYVNDHGNKKSTLGDSSSSSSSDDGNSNHSKDDGGHGHSHGEHSHTHDHGSDSSATTGSVTESSSAEK